MALDVRDKIIVVTGGAGGIGAALVRSFAEKGARHIVVADLNGDGAHAVAREVSGSALQADVSREADIQRIVAQTEAAHGTIDLFCSNAGILDFDPDPQNAASAPNDIWARAWGVNVMAHVYAARALLPRMIARGAGYFLNTASAAGLLSGVGSAPYSTTKHAAVGFAESLAIAHKDHGIRVSLLCPQAVATNITGGVDTQAASMDGVMTPEAVADCVLEGLAREAFLILPHPEVATYMSRKTQDYDRWIGGMAKLRRSLL